VLHLFEEDPGLGESRLGETRPVGAGGQKPSGALEEGEGLVEAALIAADGREAAAEEGPGVGVEGFRVEEC